MYVRVIRRHDGICGWHVCAGRAEHVVDVEPTVARTGPPDGAGRAADPPGAPKAKEHPTEEITTKLSLFVEALRQNAERAGKARRLRRYPS